MAKKLRKSNKNKMVAGVCGGVAEYFNIDPTIIRLIWAVSVICCGFGILLYILAVLIIPEN